MLNLDYCAHPEKYIDNFLAIYWTSKKVFVPVPEKEVFYKGWVYEISGKAFEGLYDARIEYGYPPDFTGICKTAKDAQGINGYFMACANSIIKEIESAEKENRKCGIKKIRRV